MATGKTLKLRKIGRSRFTRIHKIGIAQVDTLIKTHDGTAYRVFGDGSIRRNARRKRGLKPHPRGAMPGITRLKHKR